MAERAKVCTDRVLPRELMRLQRHRARAPRPHARHSADRQDLDERLDVARALHRRHRRPSKSTAREQAGWWSQRGQPASSTSTTRPMRRSASPSIRLTAPGPTSAPIAASIPLNEPTMNLGFLDGGTAAHEFGHAIGLGARASEPRGRHPMERGGRHPRAGQVAQFLGRGDDAPQHPAEVHRGSDQRHGVRSRFDHAVLLSRVVDA